MSLLETGAVKPLLLVLPDTAGDATPPSGASEMAGLIRAYDWTKTPIGPPENWSPSLRMMVSFMLSNRFPLLLWWGPKYISIYNDAYRPILGAKHPVALGRPVSEVWSEIWAVLKPLIDAPFKGGPSTWMDDIELHLNRHGFLEETHFTIAYSPVPDETAQSGIGGVLATVHEISEKVIGERRLAILRDLGSRAGDAKTVGEACELVANVLSPYTKDVPFALLYLLDGQSGQWRLAGATRTDDRGLLGVSQPLTAADAAWPLPELLRRQEMIIIDNVPVCFPGVPSDPWNEPPHKAVMLPLRSSKPGDLSGFLVAGVSSRLRFDHQYRGFFELMVAQIATSIANARAYEEERKRAESLAEIDRAKTAFFSNVSHEFRTPLTLMLGPLEQALAAEPKALPKYRGDLTIAHRSGLRLLRLVNTLLDFSRIEAGRVQASYEPVDLAALTSGLAGEFRAAMEKAGLQFVVDCPPLGSPVWVDGDMWEKIVLNLISNAFKFTLKGAVTVRLRAEGDRVTLEVKDTGIGIPKAELPRIFERFHRVEGARGRSHEGTGIGLALVHELAKLHGGSTEVESKVDSGSIFTIRIPFGNAHLPADRLRAARTLQQTAIGVQPYVEEALRWLSEDSKQLGRDEAGVLHDQFAVAEPLQGEGGEVERRTILIVDDNSDMREYLARLLAPHYDVQTAADGLEALLSIRRQLPDILLSDVMMPRLDGVALLNEIRADPALARLPVVLLSARAGEEARIEGLEAGADDYLTKPFGARELLARVATNLKLDRLRRRYEKLIESDVRAMRRLQDVGNRCVRAGEDFDECISEILDAAIDLAGADKGNIQLIDPNDGSLRIAAQRGFDDRFLSFFASVKSGEASSCGAALAMAERIVVDDVSSSPIFQDDPAFDILLRSGVRAVISTPLTSSSGAVLGMISTHFGRPHRPSDRELTFIDLLARQTADYLERRKAEEALRASESQLRAYVSASFDVVYRMSSDWSVMQYLDGKQFIVDTLEPSAGWLHKYIHPDEQPRVMGAINEAIRTKSTFELEHRVLRADGMTGWTFSRAIPLLDRDGAIREWLGAASDITLRKQHEEHQRLLIDELNHRVKNTLATIQSLAMQTFRDTDDVERAREQFVMRLLALANAHDILTRERWKGAPLNEIVDGAIAAYRSISRDRFELDGPGVPLLAKQALALSMALHELCTNAVKYGSLSNEKGSVRIQWSVSGSNGARVLRMQWMEIGGPPVTKPRRSGFGSRLIERGLARDLQGSARLEFAVSGLKCVIELPLGQQVSRTYDDGLAIEMKE
jgi:signal transduction histidine kinase/FixJ family two-component response regulator